MQWLYKKGEEPTLFKNKEAVKDALDGGWVDTPATFDNEEVSEFDGLDRDELYEIAKERGINVPSNVGKAKLLERLSESGE